MIREQSQYLLGKGLISNTDRTWTLNHKNIEILKEILQRHLPHGFQYEPLLAILIIFYFYTSFQLENAQSLATLSQRKFREKERCPLTQLHRDLPIETRNSVDCNKIARGDETEIQLSLLKKLTNKNPQKKGVSSSWPDKDLGLFINKRGCQEYKANRSFLEISPNSNEDNYPIAYSIVVHRGAGQVERLLRAIYRPQNQYCIHVDSKSSPEFYSTLSALADCFDNEQGSIKPFLLFNQFMPFQ